MAQNLPHPGCPVPYDHSHCDKCEHPLPAVFVTMTELEAIELEGTFNQPPARSPRT
jgi:hypothetical protein